MVKIIKKSNKCAWMIFSKLMVRTNEPPATEKEECKNSLVSMRQQKIDAFLASHNLIWRAYGMFERFILIWHQLWNLLFQGIKYSSESYLIVACINKITGAFGHSHKTFLTKRPGNLTQVCLCITEAVGSTLKVTSEKATLVFWSYLMQRPVNHCFNFTAYSINSSV